MSFVVLYDANVLWPAVLRDVLIRVAQTGLVQAKWTDEILGETFRTLKEKRPDLDPEKLDRTRDLMNAAIADVLVTGYEQLVEALDLPDPDDRHVLAAAIKAKAQVIVTFNLEDFPDETMRLYEIEAKHPDDFLLDIFNLDGLALHRIVQAIADSWKNPPGEQADVLQGLHLHAPQTAVKLAR